MDKSCRHCDYWSDPTCLLPGRHREELWGPDDFCSKQYNKKSEALDFAAKNLPKGTPQSVVADVAKTLAGLEGTPLSEVLITTDTLRHEVVLDSGLVVCGSK
jgi:hypothetical protein